MDYFRKIINRYGGKRFLLICIAGFIILHWVIEFNSFSIGMYLEQGGGIGIKGPALWEVLWNIAEWPSRMFKLHQVNNPALFSENGQLVIKTIIVNTTGWGLLGLLFGVGISSWVKSHPFASSKGKYSQSKTIRIFYLISVVIWLLILSYGSVSGFILVLGGISFTTFGLLVFISPVFYFFSFLIALILIIIDTKRKRLQQVQKVLLWIIIISFIFSAGVFLAS
ncbi:hypothetical protein KAW18_07555 [candidate division WOR-3 bacterium]|nr:hypothetical protein [candidate division WOR-3 bacterium]MCK4527213.1 hypothetical protein [candidate division WOR-3 bacterium]